MGTAFFRPSSSKQGKGKEGTLLPKAPLWRTASENPPTASLNVALLCVLDFDSLLAAFGVALQQGPWNTGVKIALAMSYFHGFAVARQGPWCTVEKLPCTLFNTRYGGQKRRFCSVPAFFWASSVAPIGQTTTFSTGWNPLGCRVIRGNKVSWGSPGSGRAPLSFPDAASGSYQGWGFFRSASMATYLAMRFARVSGLSDFAFHAPR